jgi:hypothetical protein
VLEAPDRITAEAWIMALLFAAGVRRHGHVSGDLALRGPGTDRAPNRSGCPLEAL